VRTVTSKGEHHRNRQLLTLAGADWDTQVISLSLSLWLSYRRCWNQAMIMQMYSHVHFFMKHLLLETRHIPLYSFFMKHLLLETGHIATYTVFMKLWLLEPSGIMQVYTTCFINENKCCSQDVICENVYQIICKPVMNLML